MALMAFRSREVTAPAASAAWRSGIVAALVLPLPESGELGRDHFVVSDLPFEGADIAGEPADVGDHLLADGGIVEGSITRDLVRDETRLLGRKQSLRGLHGQRRVGAQRPLGFHDGPHGTCGYVWMLPDEALRRRECGEGPVAGRGRPVASAHIEQDLRDAPLYSEICPQAVAPVAVGDALLDGVDSIPRPIGAGAPGTRNDPHVVPLQVDASF